MATTLFVLIVIATFVSQRDALPANLSSVGPAAASLNVAVMASGLALGFVFRLNRRDAIAIASECGLQNAALGIFIASSVLGAASLAVPSVVYALLMNVGAFALIYFARRWLASDPMRSQPALRRKLLAGQPYKAKKNCSQYLSPSALLRARSSCCHFALMPQPSPRYATCGP